MTASLLFLCFSFWLTSKTAGNMEPICPELWHWWMACVFTEHSDATRRLIFNVWDWNCCNCVPFTKTRFVVTVTWTTEKKKTAYSRFHLNHSFVLQLNQSVLSERLLFFQIEQILNQDEWRMNGIIYVTFNFDSKSMYNTHWPGIKYAKPNNL